MESHCEYTTVSETKTLSQFKESIYSAINLLFEKKRYQRVRCKGRHKELSGGRTGTRYRYSKCLPWSIRMKFCHHWRNERGNKNLSERAIWLLCLLHPGIIHMYCFPEKPGTRYLVPVPCMLLPDTRSTSYRYPVVRGTEYLVLGEPA